MPLEKGLNSDNLKRLFRKPTLEDMIILIILTLAIVSFLAYNYNLKACTAYIENNCTQYNQQKDAVINPDLNLSMVINQTPLNKITITNGNS